MKIFSLIAGISCLVIALVMFLIGSIVGGIILLLIGAINLYLYVKNKNKPKQTEYVPSYEKHEDHEFFVAGCEYNQEAIEGLFEAENEDYNLPKAKFIEEVFEKVYQYEVNYLPAQLVAEHENEYDPNAIAVYVYGNRIGYIAKKDQQAVKALGTDHAEAEIYGGKFKEPSDDEIITGETPYKAKLHIYVSKV